jgi:Heparinase II/III-like protein/Heparinase II/III N-terminus
MTPLPEFVPDSPLALFDVTTAVDRAELILAGSHTFLGVKRTDLADPNWESDAGAAAAMGNDLDGSTPQVSLKHVWELSRLAPVVDLAIAWHLTRDRRFSIRVVELLDSWTWALDSRSSFLWGSGVEAALRLMSLDWIIRLLASDPVAARALSDLQRLGPCIDRHLDRLARFPSRFSSANNHALIEAAGLVVGSIAFRPRGKAEVWETLGLKRLLHELGVQVDEAGISKEKAASYHALVTEVLVMTVASFDLAGRARPSALVGVLSTLVGGAHALVGLGIPQTGDSDDSTVFGSDLRPSLVHACDLGAAILGIELSSNGWGQTSIQSRLLRDVAVVNGESPLVRPPSDRLLAFQSWLVPLRASEVVATMRSGPIGYLSVAAHAHADFTSVELNVEGQRVLVDPGTFTYDSHPLWRRYFRSTAAHNCLCINGEDQAEYWGPFLWGTAPVARLTAFGLPGCSTASVRHNGYASAGYDVTRSVTLTDTTLTLTDRVDQSTDPSPRSSASPVGTGAPTGSLNFTFAAAMELVDSTDENVTLRLGHREFQLYAAAGWRLELLRGSAEGPGWWSNQFGSMQPTYCVRATGPLVTGSEVSTTLRW